MSDSAEMQDSDVRMRILAAAFAMLEDTHLGSISLRPLAKQSGVGLSTVLHHLGDKAALLKSIFEHAIEIEERFFERWRHATARLATSSPAERVKVVNAVFAEWVQMNRRPLLAIFDAIQSEKLQALAQTQLREWKARAGGFWSEMFFGQPGNEEIALGVAIDEAIYSMVLQHKGLYPVLRQMKIEALIVDRDSISHPKADQRGLFDSIKKSLIDDTRLEELPSTLTQRQEAIVLATAEIIVGEGFDAISHRKVGDRISVPASTIAHHFASLEQLVQLALVSLQENNRESERPPLDDVALRRKVAACLSVAVYAMRNRAMTRLALLLRNERDAELIRRLPADMFDSDPVAASLYSASLSGQILMTESDQSSTPEDEDLPVDRLIALYATRLSE